MALPTGAKQHSGERKPSVSHGSSGGGGGGGGADTLGLGLGGAAGDRRASGSKVIKV